jgi:hypothetical protein
MTDGLVELSLILIVFDCDLAKFTSLLFIFYSFFDLRTYTFMMPHCDLQFFSYTFHI